MKKRKVLFVNGMSNDFILIRTNAPIAAIDWYCRWHILQIQNGGNFEMFKPLNDLYYVEILLDDEINTREELEEMINEYTECYDFSDYYSRED